jgi:hypothetical protein
MTPDRCALIPEMIGSGRSHKEEINESALEGWEESEIRLHLVPSKGLEPPHPCGYMDLNHARLPIPPRWQVDLCCSGGLTTTTGSGRPTFLFYRGIAGCQTSAARRHAERLLLQLRVHRDVRVQYLRYRTALLRVLGGLAKRGFVGLGHTRGHIELHGRDGPA